MQQNLPRRIFKPRSQTQNINNKMSLNGSGIRDISRVLNISPNTVLSVLKKQNKKQIVNINPKFLDLKQVLKIRLRWVKCGVECIAKKRLVGCGVL